MKRKKRRVLVSVIVSALTFSLIAANLAFAKPSKLKAVVFLPPNHALATMTGKWVNAVNNELKNDIKVSLGGPETIPGMQQPEALKTGVVDIIFTVTAYATSLFPEGWAFLCSKYSPSEERAEEGFYEYMDNRFENINMKYLGRWLWSPFYLWTKNEIKNIGEFKGVKMRSASHFDRMMKELGVIPVTVAVSDTYTALERSVVEGFGFPLMGPREMSWTDSVKYIIDHPFHGSQNAVILMNLKVWNSLPKDTQEKLVSITMDIEQQTIDYYRQKNDDERQALNKAGVKFIKLPEADAEKYMDVIDRMDWEILKEKVPALVPDLKRVTGCK